MTVESLFIYCTPALGTNNCNKTNANLLGAFVAEVAADSSCEAQSSGLG